MLINDESKVLISHKRMFADDSARFFVGTVLAYADGIIKVAGYSWAKDTLQRGFCRKDGMRTKFFSIIAGTNIVYQLPDYIVPEDIAFETTQGRELLVTNRKDFQLDLTEHVQDN